MNTRIYNVDESALRPLQGLALNAIPHLNWRHHGIGVLQAYLFESGDEVRIHVWHPMLLLPGMEDSGQIHDHRFTLESTVLAGSVDHEEMRPFEGDVKPGPWQIFEIANARHAATKKEFTIRPESDKRYYVSRTSHRISEGQRYTFEKRAFHRSFVDQPAVTIVTKRDQEDRWARILAPYGSQPAHGFGTQPRIDFRPFLNEARYALAQAMIREPGHAETESAT